MKSTRLYRLVIAIQLGAILLLLGYVGLLRVQETALRVSLESTAKECDLAQKHNTELYDYLGRLARSRISSAPPIISPLVIMNKPYASVCKVWGKPFQTHVDGCCFVWTEPPLGDDDFEASFHPHGVDCASVRFRNGQSCRMFVFLKKTYDTPEEALEACDIQPALLTQLDKSPTTVIFSSHNVNYPYVLVEAPKWSHGKWSAVALSTEPFPR